MSQILNNILHGAIFKNLYKGTNYFPIRSFSKTIVPKKLQEIPLYTERDELFKISQKRSIKILEELLNCRTFIAKEIVLNYKKFMKISSYNITENYNNCISNGIEKNTLEKFPGVLAEQDILLKIKELKRLPYDINLTTPLLCFNLIKLKMFVDNEIKELRIALISKALEVEICETCDLFVKRPFLHSLNLIHVKNNIKLLTDLGVTKEEILKDLWVLRYSTSVIKEKLTLAKENNIDTLKTWMVRAKPEIFEKYVKRRFDTKRILGDNSLAEYLSERLECTEEVAKYMISKQPALQNKSLKKMNEVIDFLLMHGFKPVHICRVPKILLHSVETTRKRLKELEAQGMHLDTLYILTKSQRQYMQYYESLVKTNKNKLKNYQLSLINEIKYI